MDKQDEETKKKIKNKLKELREYPEKRGEHLKYSEFWKLRIEDYRAIYEIKVKEKKVIILFIGHRKNVYDDFSRLI
ncbi:MAG: type II toxin-antitoxin system RelE/ParE family toxin [Methanomicrobia archaeon]|nr:type II toxin-antitoxin system RelE/ParE family toxin [Methanomicrobia archaeon]